MIKTLVYKLTYLLRRKLSRFQETEAKKTEAVLKKLGQKKNKQVLMLVVGANNGLENDPFVFYAIKYGWRAILVEPNPSVFIQLRETFRYQPNITCINTAIGPKKKKLTLHSVAFSEKRWATGLTSASRKVLLKHFTNGWVQQMCKQFSDTIPKKKSNWVKSYTVSCKTIKNVLNENRAHGLDILAVDTEGMDAEIVKSAFAQGYRPNVVCWEHLHISLSKNQELKKQCEKMGYKISQDTNNIICCK